MSYVIPKQFYIGYQERMDRNWKLPIEDRVKVKLGFATYHEDNAKFEKRKETIDTWAAPYDLEYVEHEPDEHHKHGWRERVQHPRDDLKSELVFNDPEKSEVINQKLQLIYSLQKKHQVQTVEELIIIQAELESKVVSVVTLEE